MPPPRHIHVHPIHTYRLSIERPVAAAAMGLGAAAAASARRPAWRNMLYCLLLSLTQSAAGREWRPPGWGGRKNEVGETKKTTRIDSDRLDLDCQTCLDAQMRDGGNYVGDVTV
jgi:hypothetical protein